MSISKADDDWAEQECAGIREAYNKRIPFIWEQLPEVNSSKPPPLVVGQTISHLTRNQISGTIESCADCVALIHPKTGRLFWHQTALHIERLKTCFPCG